MQNSQAMKLFPSSSNFLFSLSFFVLFFGTDAVIKLPGNNEIPAVIMFGDSIVDTGNNNYIKTPAKCNFPPYGRDFTGGIPTGRFSNGKIPSDIIVEELGIKELLPPYLQPNLQPEELLTGVSFASGGCGYDPLTSKAVLAISLYDQLRLFEEYIDKLKETVGDQRTGMILKTGLFVVVASSNDIANTYFGLRARKFGYDISSYTDLLLHYALTFLKELYGLGARRIGVLGTPPLGCLPSSRTLGGVRFTGRDCAENYNQAAKLFNAKLSAEIESLNSNLLDARVVYIDTYNVLLLLIQNFDEFGFEIVKKGCCGTGTVETSILCNQFSPNTCTNVSEYLFWDSYHPTEKAYRILVSNFLNKYMGSFF